MNEKGEETIMAFVHLHTHTEYSLLDGSNKIKEYVSRVKELGMNSAAITDHGNMYGVVEFYKTAKAADINPVIGCEIYVAPNSRFDRETSHGGPVLPSDPACGKQYRLCEPYEDRLHRVYGRVLLPAACGF